MTALLFAASSAIAFGLLSVAIRIALRGGTSAELGSLVTSLSALCVTILAAVASRPSAADLRPSQLWPFLLAGVLAPGLSQLMFFLAVRDLGASRTSVVVGTAPLVAVAIALVALDEPARIALLVAAVLVVLGSVALGLEGDRPVEFKRIGALLALASTVLFATRDDVLRWLATGTKAPPLPAAAVAMAGGAATLTGYLLLRRRLRLGELRRAAPRFLLPGLLFGGSYALLFEAYYRGRVTIVSPLVATESLFAVLFSILLLRRSEGIGRHVVLGALLVVAGGALIGASR
ncbi:MAG TPA: DMT family transporter [Gaiellaceae bacterium]